MNLSPEQNAAVNCAADMLLVTASAGSGKTRVIIERIVRKIESGVHPNRICCVSFTNAAANELDRRVRQRMGWPAQSGSYLGFAGTLHSFMVRLLMRFGPAFGFPAKFGILSEQQAVELLEEVATESRYSGTGVALEAAVRDWLSYPMPASHWSKPQLVAGAFYQRVQRNNLVTFDMILHRGLAVLRQIKPDQWPYDVLLCDEVQDSGDLDMAIYQAMPCSEKIYVGDQNQAIFSFRGGNVSHFTAMLDNPAVQKVYLTRNFRSDECVVKAANRLNGTVKMVSVSGKPGAVAIRDSETGESEIVDVAKLIREAQPASVAVLVRTNALVAEWATGLENMGLTVARQSIAMPVDWPKALAFVALLSDPENDWLAYKAVLLSKGREVADEVRRQSLAQLKSINQVALQLTGQMSLNVALERLARMGLSAESVSRLADLASQLTDGTVQDLLFAVSHASFKIENKAGVVVSTVHSAKGLEFDVVFMPAFEDGILPTRKGDEAEEKRLAYVGITRARHVCILSYALKRRNRFTRQYEPAIPSRFLTGLVS